MQVKSMASLNASFVVVVVVAASAPSQFSHLFQSEMMSTGMGAYMYGK